MCYDTHRDTEKEKEDERPEHDRDDIEVKDLTDDRNELIHLMQESGLIMVKRKQTDQNRQQTS